MYIPNTPKVAQKSNTLSLPLNYIYGMSEYDCCGPYKDLKVSKIQNSITIQGSLENMKIC